MGNTWHATYDQIKDFVARSPSIQIRADVLSIPGDVRQDFYHLFDSLKENFIKDNFSGALEEAQRLSNNHEKVRNELITTLGLTDVEVETGLGDFLRNPGGLMAGMLTDPVFDLLMGKSSQATFEEISTSKVRAAFDTFLHQGYQSWLTQSLMQLMEPDQAYIVPLSNDITAASDCDIGTPGTGHLQMPPDAELANGLSFNRTPFFAFLVPKVIVHSKRLNLYASFLQEFRDVTAQIRYPNEQQEWFRLTDLAAKSSHGKRWPDLVIYLGRQANDLLVVADMCIIARPDMIVNILYKKDLGDAGKLAMIKSQDENLKPRLGSIVICPEALSVDEIESFKSQIRPGNQASPVKPGDAQEAAGSLQTPATSAAASRDIQIIGVGYDSGNLESIAGIIVRSQRYVEFTSNQDVSKHD